MSCPPEVWKPTNLMTPRIEQPDQSIEAEVLKAETQAAMDTLQELQAQFEVVSAEARSR